jgi:hypothetical protein
MEAAHDFAALLQASPLGVWARGSTFGYPFANLIHLLGLVLLLGSVLYLDLRIAGFIRTLPLQASYRIFRRVSVLGILLLLPSGFVLFAADAVPLLSSAIFLWKIALIAVALLNVILFGILWDKRLREGVGPVPDGARIMAFASLGLWFSAASLGRLIAYF